MNKLKTALIFVFLFVFVGVSFGENSANGYSRPEIAAIASRTKLYFIGDDNYSIFEIEGYKIEFVGIDVSRFFSPYIEGGKLVFRSKRGGMTNPDDTVSVEFPNEVRNMWNGRVPDNLFDQLARFGANKHPISVDGALYVPVNGANTTKIFSSSGFLDCITSIASGNTLIAVAANFENDKVIGVDVKSSKAIWEFEIPHLKAPQSLFQCNQRFAVATIYARTWCGCQIIDLQQRTVGELHNADLNTNYFVNKRSLFGFDLKNGSLEKIFDCEQK